MASSAANFLEDKLLDLTFNGSAYAGQSTVYVKLHTGAPGEDCTGNAATETTRKAVTFGASSGGVVTSDAACTWTNVAGTETYTAISLWDASSGGNALCYMDLTASRAVVAGDSFTIDSGDISVTLS